jgi:hypothetical protein
VPTWRSEAQFGEVARLLGFDTTLTTLENEGLTPVFVTSMDGTLTFTLYWQAIQETDTSYSVFIHLLDDQGELVSQHDGVPAGGARPTTGWIEGEIIVDEIELPVGELVQGQTYSIIVGLYDPNSGQRLHVSGIEDHLILARAVAR